MSKKIWEKKSIEEHENAILDSEEGPLEFLNTLINLHSPIAVWLTDGEHSALEGGEFILLVYLVEVILKSSAENWEELAAEIDVEELSELEEHLWKLNNKQKKVAIQERFTTERIAMHEPALYTFIGETIEDFNEEHKTESIVNMFLWICSLTIAGIIRVKQNRRTD